MESRGLLLADRELSWIAFNGRVLQEAADASVALSDRIDFLAIVSSNLDEFFRVRVASLRSLLRLTEAGRQELSFDPGSLLASIHAAVDVQQTRFGMILREQLLPALRERGVDLVMGEVVDGTQREALREYFEARVAPRLRPVVLGDGEEPPFLENRGLYLVVELAGGVGVHALIRIPAELPRWVEVAGPAGVRTVLFLDDVIRMHLGLLFGGDEKPGRAWAVKLSRDAELQLEDEFGGDLVAAMRKAIRRRARGAPCRFLYDATMPTEVVHRLQAGLDLAPEDLFPGGRYHNLHDLFTLPRPASLREPAPAPLAGALDPDVADVLGQVRARDRLLHLPYQSYDGVLRFLRAGADDPMVEEVRITLYRVAKDSGVVDALMRAALNGKRVTAFIEARARFDEETNLDYGERLEAAGARVRYGRPGVKVHAKLALITRREEGKKRHYAYLGTGNFNERTARVYADVALLTAEPRLAKEVKVLFDWLWDDEAKAPRFEQLLVAPLALRSSLEALIAAEAEAARASRASGITLKLNSLEDPAVIRALYDAALAGVPIRLIVRGICRLIPDQPELRGNIEGRSIVDRYLEHARVYRFHAGGADRIYLASSDLMTRNLDRRVEVAFPIHDERARAEIIRMLELQLADNVKARRMDGAMSNAYVRDAGPPVRAQVAFREYLADGGM